MTAEELIKELVKLADHHEVSLSDLEVNIRVNYGQDVYDVNWVMEDLYDAETNSILKSVVLMDDGDTENYEH